MTLCNAMMMCVGIARKGRQRLKTKTPLAGFRVPLSLFEGLSVPWGWIHDRSHFSCLS